MSWLLPAPIARVLTGLWLSQSPHSWRHRVIADDEPFVNTPGSDPDRVFMIGDGIASGRGVVTHALGLPGYLARSLSRITGRATDVELAVHPEMTVTSSLAALEDIDLLRFDVILLFVGHREVLGLMPVDRWVAHLHALLAEMQRRTSADTQIFVLSIPTFERKTPLPPVLARRIDAHAAALNAATADMVTEPNVTVLSPSGEDDFEPETSDLYEQWADEMAFHIAKRLDPDRVPIGDVEATEEARRRALMALQATMIGTDAVLDGITETARRVFGAPIAAITFIGEDSQTTRAVSGAVIDERPRAGSFCDVTIRRSAHHIVEDTRADSRFAHYAVSGEDPSIRFYAGFPITSPDGHRVGALCIMDERPRRFSRQEMKLLSTLTELAESHLWRAPGGA
ncbi:GAF domain-containing protein [Labedella endophytica]|uniref:GAF domain-containing protein n=1 Tax=Labedella endophytica TaxID=1523160 RepID=A0A433JMN7_9MICO|nr:GAF domain-containing protein [Labedella endophytica]RUQ96899.1 GAF domain-containing protein [Labedella endophytica]